MAGDGDLRAPWPGGNGHALAMARDALGRRMAAWVVQGIAFVYVG